MPGNTVLGFQDQKHSEVDVYGTKKKTPQHGLFLWHPGNKYMQIYRYRYRYIDMLLNRHIYLKGHNNKTLFCS